MPPSLRIVLFNDVYSLTNLPRLATLVARYREHDVKGTTLVVLAGDFLSPSLLSSIDHGRAMVDCLNDIGVTHAVLGNHEDDLPSAELHARIGELHALCLGTNLPGFDPKMPAFDVVPVGGEGRAVRVGLVGTVLTDPSIYRRPPFDGKAMAPANDVLLRMAKALYAEEGCASVIPITHQPLSEDKALILKERTPPFPVLLGGHEHELHLEQLEGTWLVKAGSEAEHAVIVDLEWPDEAPRTGEPDVPVVTVRVDDSARFSENADLRAKIDRHMAKVAELENAPLLALPKGEVLSSVGTRVRQTSIGTLLASRIRDALGADLAFVNGGGIRGSREYKECFTYGDLKSEVPFDNELVVARLPGALVRDAILASRSKAPAPSGGFLQLDDRAALDGGGAIVAVDGAPFDAARIYHVALVRNLLLGLDHVEPLERFGREHPDHVPPIGSGREVKLVLVDAFAAEIWRTLGAFEDIDRDRDGHVSREELARKIGEVSGRPASAVTTGLVMDALDDDRDGAIGREEGTRKRGPSRG